MSAEGLEFYLEKNSEFQGPCNWQMCCEIHLVLLQNLMLNIAADNPREIKRKMTCVAK